jgi:plastocyanin
MKSLIAVPVLALVMTACGGSGTPSGSSTTPVTTPDGHGSDPAHVEVKDIEFVPAELSVAAGETVVWSWVDTAAPHNVVANDQTFSSGDATADPDTEFEFTFDEPGTYEYLCTVHGKAMSGTVTVS